MARLTRRPTATPERRLSRVSFGIRTRWLDPRVIALTVSLPLLLASYLVSADSYRVLYGTPKYVDVGFVLVGLISYAALFSGMLVPDRSRTDRIRDVAECLEYSRQTVTLLFILTLVGYATWVLVAISNAGGLSSLADLVLRVLTFRGGSDALKQDVFTSVSGVTTLTQVGILYATVEALLWRLGGEFGKSARLRATTITALTVLRVLLNSERLALVEVAVPVFVVALIVKRDQQHKTQAIGARIPILGTLGLFSLFSVGEYFRSWSNYYRAVYGGPYIQFAAERLLGYYVTALNNAAIYAQHQATQVAHATLADVLNFPVVGVRIMGLYEQLLSSPGTVSHGALLSQFGNPEFNNVAMIGLLQNDFTLL